MCYLKFGVSVEDGHTTVPLATGDSIATDTIIDFIKIDVEGLALEVLSGLELTIARNRPAMFIELDDKDSCSFETWLEEANYRIVGCLVRYETQTNYIVIPQEMKKPPIHPSAKS